MDENIRRIVMKKIVYVVLFFSLSLVIRCAGTGGLTALEEVIEDNVMIVGNAIVENIDQGFAFDNWDLGFEVVIIGKIADGTLSQYTVPADNRGYYCLQNVPPGQYALKAVIIPVTGGRPLKIVNDLNTFNSEFYRMRYPERPIEKKAEWLPMKKRGRVINFGIKWFGLRTARIEDMDINAIGKIMLMQFSESVRSRRMWDQGYPHSRQDPLTHFKEKFPESGWWKL